MAPTYPAGPPPMKITSNDDIDLGEQMEVTPPKDTGVLNGSATGAAPGTEYVKLAGSLTVP
jgi:hypothetical protein